MKKLIFTILCYLCCFSAAFAVKVNGLYRIELPIAAQTEDLKEQAIKDGFLELLIRLSGNPDIGKNPIIQENLKRPDYYVQELSYSPSTTTSSQYLIQIRYEKDDVNRLLKKAGIAYWGENRPLILVWLAITGKHHETEIISNEMPGEIFIAMKGQSKKYGLPLIFPMMDVADISQISPIDVISMSLPDLTEAAKRYAPDALLIGYIDENNTRYQSQWQLVLGKKRWKWTMTDNSMNQAIASIMNQVGQTLSKLYMVHEISIQQQWLKLEVMNITQRSDLEQLLKFLKTLSPMVQQVQLSQISSDVADLLILIRGSVNGFINHPSVNKHLALKYQDRVENKLVFVWVN